jgi:ABC-type bacteriocin/lantibiotic exporter with double-glycine peptidase domain
MENSDQSGVQKDAPRGFLSALLAFISDIFKDVASSMLVVVLTFCFATVVTAGMLWYYQWPLFLSPVGGFIVLGVMLLLWNDS